MINSSNSSLTRVPSYYLGVVNVDGCGSTKLPGDSIFVSWSIIDGAPGYNSCYVAVRPIADLKNDGAIVADVKPYPQCGGSSTNVVIPELPINPSFPFNGSLFTVRVNTMHGNGIYADSCTFK